MEASCPLAIESFSNSWLVNINSSIDHIKKDQTDASSNRFKEEAQDFEFDTPISRYLVHADQLFANGFILPIYIDPSKIEPSSSSSSKALSRKVSIHYCSIRKWCKSSKQIARKYFRVIRPSCEKVGGLRKSTSRVEALMERREWKAQSLSNSLQGSPQNTDCSLGDWFHIESSIHEAVLHCKRSIGMLNC